MLNFVLSDCLSSHWHQFICSGCYRSNLPMVTDKRRIDGHPIKKEAEVWWDWKKAPGIISFENKCV